MMLRNILFPILVFAFSVSAFSQSKYWDTVLFFQPKNTIKTNNNIEPGHYTLLSLNLESFATHLQKAPERNIASRVAGLIVEFPDHNGQFTKYKIQKASVLHPDLVAKYPYKSYVVITIKDTSSTILFSTNLLDSRNKRGLYFFLKKKNKIQCFV